MMADIGSEVWQQMSDAAWQAREGAYVHGKTRVGAAVLTSDDRVFAGCNVEHIFRSHDVHAEVNALGSMVAAGHTRSIAVLVVAERERFTPCGSCLDWIFELGGPMCIVGFQQMRNGPVEKLLAGELMPHYPA